MLNVTSTPVELIDDDTATTYYNDLDTLEGAERETRAEALRLWADQKDADQKREQFDAVNKIYSDFDGYVNEAGLQDFDEDSRYRTANRQFIASQFDQTPEEQQDIYSSFRDKWTESVAGKTGLSEKETFGLIKQGIDARNEVSEAANQIPGDIALSLFDSIGGGDPVDVPKLIETWKTKNAESIKKLPPGWETPLLESAQAFHNETEGMLRDYAEPLKKVYDHLSAVTGRDTERAGETNPKNEEEMDSMVDTLASMPKPVRERAYASVVLGAQKAGQDPKTFMEQWGESWSRTLNMVRTGALTAQEMAAESEARQLENKETPPDYFISKSTGEKIPLANSAFHDEADLRKVTPEEIAADAAKARQKVKRFEVIRELKNVADNQFDPIEKINKGGFLGFMESMAYGSPQGLAYTATALVPVVGPYLAGAAMFSDEYDQLRSQGMNVDQAIQVGSVSAAIQAGLERTGAKALFGKLPVFEKLMRKIGNPARVGKAGSAGVRFLTAATGEQLVEGAQDLTTPLVQDVAEALGADVPDVKWQPILEKWEGSRLDVLAASLPTIFFGTGVASFADNKRFAQFEERQDIYRMTGMDDAAIKKIEDGKDLAEVQQNFQTEFGKLTPENVKAGVSYIEGKITSAQEQQQDSNTHTLTRETLADGSKKFVIRDPKGEVRYSTADAQTAQIAISELLRNQITGTTRGIFESMSFFNQMNEAAGRGEDIQKFLLSDAPRNLLTDYEANPTEKNLDNLFETVRAFGQDISEPAELANFPVLASNQGALSEGIFKSVIQIHEGATGDKVVRDVAQDNLKRAIAEQRITMDWVRENLNQIIPQIDSERITGYRLRTETDTDVIESFSDVALAYMTGHVPEGKIPAGFRGFLRRIAIVVKDIYRRAYNLKRLVAEGKVDANFETLLADSVGLNQQARVDTARERVASDVLTDTNYSIGTTSYPMEDKGKWYANEDFAQRGGQIVTMSPDQFLSQVRPLEVDDASRDNIDDLKNMMQSGRKLDPLAIYADGKEDGRHRAIAAKELGMDTIPVIDFRQPVSTDTGATNYSIKVNTTAANTLADNLKIPKNLGPEYADRHIIPIEADLTAGGGSFTQKPAQGGPAFSVIPQYYNAGVAWAAAKDGFWTGKLNLARESGAIFKGNDGREKFLVAPYAMKQDSHISNPTVAGEKFAEVSRYISEKRINKTQQKGLSDLILNASTDGVKKASDALKVAKKEVMVAESAIKKFKGEKSEKAYKDLDADLKAKKGIASDALAKQTFFQGISKFPTSLTTKAFDSYLSPLSFDQRKWLGEKLSSAAAEKLGAPPMDQIRRATLDESFAGTDNLSLISILEIDVKKLEDGLKNKTLTAKDFGVTPHNSYNSLAPGSPVAFFRTPIPYSQAFPDIRSGLIGSGFNTNHGYFLKGKIPEGLARTQKISAQMISDWGDAQTSLRPNQAKAIVTALNQGWKTYAKPRQAGLAEFTRALRNNDAAVTLTQYSSEEVSQLLKEGKMKIFQLGDMNVWFALKRPGEGEAGDPKKDWHIVSVANNEKGAPGMLPLIMSKALAEGGTHLDCYAVKSSKYPDGLLPTLYAKSGFEATEVLPFDPQYHTEPGKMGELQKVWDSQKWNGQEKPPLVYMKWNAELHANIGRNQVADTTFSRKRSGAKDGRSMARPTDSSLGRVADGASVEMGGAGQGDQGRGVSDGSSPTGAAGNARNILPRGIEQIVADLGNLNDYQLQALGLTRTEVDEAIKNYNDPNSLNYSIASQSEIDRVNKALGGMNRGPDERLKVYQRAKQKFSKLMAWNSDELAAMADTGSDESQIRRTQILQALGELDGILSVLPPEVRGRVGGYTKLAGIAPHDVLKDGVKVSEVSGMNGAIISAWMREGQNIGQAGKQVSLPPGYTATENLSTKRADKVIADFFRDRIKRMDTELEKVLVREYTEAITKVVKQSRPKAGDNGVRKSTLGAETQKFADTVLRATLLDDEATAKRMAEIEAALTLPDATAEDISALSEEWSILNTFGDLDNRSSETLAQGLDWLKGQFQMGREAWRIKEQARIDEQRARNAATIEWLGKGTAKKRNATKTKSELASDLANHYLLSHANFEQFVTAIFPPEIATKWSDRLRKADEASQAAEIRDRKGIIDAVRAGAKAANMSTADAMLWLKADQKNAVSYLEGRKVKDERIAIDLAQKIVTGEADRSKLTDSDVETLRNELAALPADTQKEFVTIKRVIFRGEDVKLDMSRGKAMQYLLSWNQPDVQIKMRKEGWTDDSAADLKALVNDPVSREVMAYAKELYGKGAGIVNPVYSRMFGMNMPQVKNYAPTRFINAKDTKDIGLDGSPSSTGTTPGFAKSRVTHSAKIAPEDALNVMQGHIAQQAHWVHFAELAREFRAILSNPEVRESIKQTHGESVLKDAELWADQMEQRGGNKARESTWMNTILGTVLSGKAVSSLGFNLKTLAMQLDNTVRFGLALDMSQIVSALSNPSTIVEDIQTVWESEAIQNRLQGGATAEAKFLFSRYAGKPNFAAKIAEASMTPINWMDSAATSISSAIVYRANLIDALKAGMPEQLAKQTALDAASKAIYQFAQPVSFGQKSIIENNGNVMAKMFFLFMSDARLKTAVLADAARGLATGSGDKGTHIRRILAIETMAVLSHVVSSAFRDGLSDDDDEEIWNLGGFAKAILLAPLQGYFFAGTLGELAISKLTGQKTFNSTTQNPLLSAMEQGVRAGNNLEDAFDLDDPDAMFKEWNNIFRSMALSPAMAAPAVLLNMVKPVMGLYENAKTED